MNNIKFHCKKGYMKNIPEAYLELCQKPKMVFLQKKVNAWKMFYRLLEFTRFHLILRLWFSIKSRIQSITFLPNPLTDIA